MSSYKKEFISGVFYTSVAKYTGIFIQIAISMVLARLLEPSDFGIIAIASVFISFINLLTDFGFGPAIIQKDNLEENDLRSIFSLTFIIGIIGALLLIGLSYPVGQCYDSDDVKVVLMILSVNAIFVALNIVPNALLLKAKKFKLIAVRTLLMQVLGGIVGIILAFIGCGLYSLVAQSIVSAAGIFVFNYNQYPMPLLNTIYRSSLSKVLSFSILQFISSLINYTTKAIDKPLVGKYLSMDSLGYYEKSYRLMQLPVNNLSYVFTPVMQPLFKDFKSDMAQMFAKYSKLLKVLSLIGFPLSVTLYCSSYELIHIFYGGKWDMAVEPFKYLSLGVGFMILLSSSGPIYQASNKMKIMLVVNVTECIISLTCLFFSLQSGHVLIVAKAISLGILFRFVSVFFILSFWVFRISPLLILKGIFPGIVFAILLACAYSGIASVELQMPLLVQLFLKCILFLIMVLIGLYTMGDIKMTEILKKK